MLKSGSFFYYFSLAIERKYLWTLSSSVISGWNAVASKFPSLAITNPSSMLLNTSTLFAALIKRGARIKMPGKIFSPITGIESSISALARCGPKAFRRTVISIRPIRPCIEPSISFARRILPIHVPQIGKPCFAVFVIASKIGVLPTAASSLAFVVDSPPGMMSPSMLFS